MRRDEKQKQREALWKHLRMWAKMLFSMPGQGAHRSGAGGLSPLPQPQTQVPTHQPYCVWPHCQERNPDLALWKFDHPPSRESPHTIIHIITYSSPMLMFPQKHPGIRTLRFLGPSHTLNCNCKMGEKGEKTQRAGGPAGRSQTPEI